MEITIDNLYDMMRNHIKHTQSKPNYILIHPHDANKIKELFISQFGYYQHSINNDNLEFNGVKFIRSYDIEESKPIFVT
jgi:hypothetical protein